MFIFMVLFDSIDCAKPCIYIYVLHNMNVDYVTPVLLSNRKILWLKLLHIYLKYLFEEYAQREKI